MTTQNGAIATEAEITEPSKLTVVSPSDKPTYPGEWPLDRIISALSRPLPRSVLSQRKQGGAAIDYIPWHTAVKILNKYAPGWSWEIRQMHTTSDRLFIIGRLTIPTADGPQWREATGTEELKETVTNKKTGEVELREIAYGDPSSNAESMALRRAAAKFGLGLYLYTK
jgi:hypothetical protein